MTDDPMDDLLIEGARDYNAPGAVPREDMWARIEAARAARRPAASPQITPRSHVERAGRHTIWAGAAALAAGLVLWAGIVIGRRVERSEPSKVTAAPVIASSGRSTEPTPKAQADLPAAPPPVVDRDSVVTELKRETQRTAQQARALAASATPVAASSSEDVDANRALAFRLVVMQHLAGSEALITAFRSEARRGEVDAQLAAWSRELLSTTRMLETSAASHDPTMRRLLEDLDLVISQIARYTASGHVDADDLDLIEQSIDKRGVMDKLRALPGRPGSAGT